MWIRENFKQLLQVLARIGADPDDNADVRLLKASLVASTLLIILAGIIWGLFYIVFAERLAASIPLGYAIISSLNLLIFSIRRDYHVFRFVQLLLILLLPFLLMLALGGFVNSSAVILWSLLSPLHALLFADAR